MKLQNFNFRPYLVYTYTSPSGKVYVGVTSRTLKERAGKDGYNYLDSKIFYNAILKYGWDSFTCRIILEEVSQSEAFYAEKYLIAWYKSHKISYNITAGGEGTQGFSHPVSEETREKIRQANLGRKHSPESIEKMRIALLNRGPISEETREKLRISHLGHKDSEETKRKKSEAAKNKTLSEKLLLVLKATREKPKSDKTKQKIRETLQKTSFRNKAVELYTLDGEFVAEYISASEAGRITGFDPSSIRKVCKGKLKKCGNYVWKEKI